MKYLKFFESFKDINEVEGIFEILRYSVVISKDHMNKICKKYGIEDYTINKDGTIDVDYVDLSYENLTKIPLKFNKVNVYFSCGYNKLISLEGSPIEVNGNFSCSNNQLTSFEFSPKIIRGIFNCAYNNIKTFEYFPSFVKNEFYCYDNPIYEVWCLFGDLTKIELLNDFDIFRDEDTDEPSIVMVRLNDFLLTIGKDPVEKVDKYKNI